MAKRPVVVPIQGGDIAVPLNLNFSRIAAQFDDTLSRTGQGPNFLSADLDMNGNDVMNIGTLAVDALEVAGEPITDYIDDQVGDAAEAAVAEQVDTMEAIAGVATAAAQAAANSAATLSGTVVTIEQNADGSWPARPAYPAYPAVEFWGETFPTGLMVSKRDKFINRTEQDVPVMPDPQSWGIFNAHNGTQFLLRVFNIDTLAVPALTGMRYIVDGGVPVELTWPLTLPFQTLVGASPGARSVVLQQRNALGWGNVSFPPKTVTVSDAPFTDNFNRSNQNLDANEYWTQTVTPAGEPKLIIDGGVVQLSSASNVTQCTVNDYFPDNQYAQALVLGGGNNNNIIRGIRLGVRGQADPTLGYFLAVRNTEFTLFRGTTVIATVTHGVTIGAGQTCRLSANGTNLSVQIGASAFGPYVDATYTSGNVSLGIACASSDGAANVRCDNFEADAL